MFRTIILAFIPLFVAVNAIGILPVFVSLTEKMTVKERRDVVIKSLITAICLAVSFVFLGKAVFRLLGITVADFMVAGGALLFCIAIIELLNPTNKKRMFTGDLGFVPLGTPLIVGPAVLTTSLLMLDAYGLVPTLVSVVANLGLLGALLFTADFFVKILGDAGARAIAKIISLLLAAIAVMMIRKGIILMLTS